MWHRDEGQAKKFDDFLDWKPEIASTFYEAQLMMPNYQRRYT